MSGNNRVWESYSEESVKNQGRADGRPWTWRLWPFVRESKNSYPGPDLPYPAPFWTKLQEAADTAGHLLAAEWKEESKSLYDAWRKADTEYERAKIEAGKELADAHGASKASNEAATVLRNCGRSTLNKRVAVALLLVLGAGEAFFNGIIFQLLGEGMVATVILALALSVTIPWIGHFIGVHLKQEERRPMDWLLILLGLLAALAGLLAVAVFRGMFIEAGDMSEVLGISIPVAHARNLFFAINITLLVGSVLASYMAAHPKAADYQSKRGTYQDLKKKAEKEGAEGLAANLRLQETEMAVNAAAQNLQDRYGEMREKAEAIRARNRALAAAYMDENLKARVDQRQIACFMNPTTNMVEIPSTKLPDMFKDAELKLTGTSVHNQYEHPQTQPVAPPAQGAGTAKTDGNES